MDRKLIALTLLLVAWCPCVHAQGILAPILYGMPPTGGGGTCAAPAFSPTGGYATSFTLSGSSCSVQCTSMSMITVTVPGTCPIGSNLYTGSVSISPPVTYYAVGTDTGKTASSNAVFNTCVPASGYSNCGYGVIQSGQITGTLTNFPALMSLSSTLLKTVANSGDIQNTCTQSGSSFASTIPADFIFTSDSGGTTAITGYEWESYSATAGTGLVWVNVASAAVGTVVYFSFNNAAVSTCQNTVSGAWNSAYAAVLHFPNGSALNISNSTSNSQTVTSTGATATTGEIDGAESNASTNFVQLAAAADLNTAPFSWEIWFKNSSSYAAGGPLIMGTSSTTTSGCYFIIFTTEVNLGCKAASGGAVISLVSSTGFNDGIWHHAAATMAGTGSGAAGVLYVDGASVQSSTTSGAWVAGSNAIRLGKGLDAVFNPYVGAYDEMRATTSVLTGPWIAADYKTQSAPGSFWSITY